MLQALRDNSALLKLDLYCKGLRLDDSCLVEEDGGRKILRTRAGLGSGLELILPGGLWTNVPVTERFVERSPTPCTACRGRRTAATSCAGTAPTSRRCGSRRAPPGTGARPRAASR